MIRPGVLVLADGSLFEGELFGARPASGIASGEVVFNTVLAGYQEVITDPSYAGQIITFTNPHIGNYGSNSADDESPRAFCRGVIVREISRRHSNWRASSSLDDRLRQDGISGIGGIDTRRLTRLLRDTGAMPGAFGSTTESELRAAAATEPGTDGVDLVAQVTTPSAYSTGGGPRRVVAIDYGIKRTILRCLGEIATVDVVPASTSAADILALRPDGVFLSNGPGDPATVPYAVDTIRGLLGEVPVFGICLGHQLLCRAIGGTTYKLPFGHHGGNHPVRHEATGHVEITSQNHNFCVDQNSLPGSVDVTHVNLNDLTNEGMRLRDVPAFSVQYHPEAGPGPHDSRYLFEMFDQLMADPSGNGSQDVTLMPKRTDISSILIIGSGPIVIGQACEFDYSGTQACRVLKEEGYRVILANSNPATIMTDPDFADATYIEPLTPEVVARIIERERPDAVLPTLGGQTGLNIAMTLFERGLIGVPGTPEMIGANAEAISTAEDREKFKQAMIEIGLSVPSSGTAHTLEEAMSVVGEIGLPIIIRPAYILGGRGTGIAATMEEFAVRAADGLAASPISEILIEKSIAGWKEYELEVMRDRADNVVIICSIENVDPMGVHTGDSITVAPAQTLSDVEYQEMRDAAIACIRRVGVETGGSNVQFAVNPDTGEQVVIEMNPRVSRSSALASKATGFPIAKIAAKLAIGYTLDEIPNDITASSRGITPASFEPSIDYVVTKIPRWAFEKLPGTKGILGTQMQSVGEVMSIGRTFPESLQKALRSLENGRLGLNCDPGEAPLRDLSDDELLAKIAIATPDRIFQIGELLRRDVSIELVTAACRIDPWFLDQMSMITEERAAVAGRSSSELDRAEWKRVKQLGFADAQLAHLWSEPESHVRASREAAGVMPTFKTVDTCAAEFAAETPYHYSTWEDESEIRPSSKPTVVILGSGPNRIGQGIEFDYCCVHASFVLRDAGFSTVMVNCNPETVSTDYDTSDRLYFEPLTFEDVTNVIAAETAAAGGMAPKLIVSLGGQTPLKLASLLPVELIAGTSPESIDLAEDREKWNALCEKLCIPQPPGGTAATLEQARRIVEGVGYPVLVRPSYVLGGRGMQIVHDDDHLARAMAELTATGSVGKEGGLSAERPVLIDRFLEDAVEVDVDAIRDATGEVLIGGVMEHVEEAGVHSGDSACAIPPQTLPAWVVEVIESYTRSIAAALDVRGLINVQYAVTGTTVHVIEANPRASRTVPFVAKATGVPLAKVATRVMLGATLAELRTEGLLCKPSTHGHVAIKEAVLPFSRFPEVDTALGPEMRSTGEVMGIDMTFGKAFFKAELAAGTLLPTDGTVFLSLADGDKPAGLVVAKRLRELGLGIAATSGTAAYLARFDQPVDLIVGKVNEGADLTAVDLIADGKVSFVINTPQGRGGRTDGEQIRKAANTCRVSSVTTIAAALAAVHGMAEQQGREMDVRPLQSYHSNS